ncbi:MAG: MSMEG_4193 family putative phosphomutase [Candidatus Promineifilaceae bacterium]|jgi:probable phosphomutase (TIGR03848 family)
MTIFLLVRHGKNDWVKKHRLAGWLPGVHLNETGRLQAQDVGSRLASQPVKAIYSSPVTRCVETAEYIAPHFDLPIILNDEFGETRYGKWEGKKIEKLAKKPAWKVVQFFPSRMRFPKGESLLEVQYRGVQALEKLTGRHKSEIVVVVSHADLIKLVLAHYLGVHIDLFQRIGVSPASVSVLNLSDQGFVRVLRINDDGPLKPFMPEPKHEKSNKEG